MTATGVTAGATGGGAAGFGAGGAAAGTGVGTAVGTTVATGTGVGGGAAGATVTVGPLRVGELRLAATAMNVTLQVPLASLELPVYVPSVALPEVRVSGMVFEPTSAVTLVAAAPV